MNLEKIEELWAKDAEAFFDHRELPELLANDSMETPRLHAKYLQLHRQSIVSCIKRSGYIIMGRHHPLYTKRNHLISRY